MKIEKIQIKTWGIFVFLGLIGIGLWTQIIVNQNRAIARVEKPGIGTGTQGNSKWETSVRMPGTPHATKTLQPPSSERMGIGKTGFQTPEEARQASLKALQEGLFAGFTLMETWDEPSNKLEGSVHRRTLLELSKKSSEVTPAEFEQYVNECIQMEPNYHGFFEESLQYRQKFALGPEKLGQIWMTFANQCENSPDPEMKIMLARMVCSKANIFSNIFAETSLDWTKVRESFEAWRKAFPNSRYVLNQYAFNASLAGDRIQAKMLFEIIGDHPSQEVWTTIQKYKANRKWADE